MPVPDHVAIAVQELNPAEDFWFMSGGTRVHGFVVKPQVGSTTNDPAGFTIQAR